MAIYNNGYPTYQPYPSYAQPNSYSPQQPQMPSNNMSNNGIVWVQGEAGAKAYPVGSGNSVMLLDSENSVFYIKSTDISGMPLPLRIFDFKERTTSQPLSQASFENKNYVTHEELNKILESFKGGLEDGKSIEEH